MLKFPYTRPTTTRCPPVRSWMGNPTRMTGMPRRSVRNFPPEWPIAMFASAINPASSIAAKSVSSRMTGCSSASARSVASSPVSRLLFVPLAMTTGSRTVLHADTGECVHEFGLAVHDRPSVRVEFMRVRHAVQQPAPFPFKNVGQ